MNPEGPWVPKGDRWCYTKSCTTNFQLAKSRVNAFCYRGDFGISVTFLDREAFIEGQPYHRGGRPPDRRVRAKWEARAWRSGMTIEEISDSDEEDLTIPNKMWYSANVVFATSLEPKLATKLEPKLATSLEPKLAISFEPKLATSLEPKLATSLEPKLELKFATLLESKFATSLEPKFATSLEPKFDALAQAKISQPLQLQSATSRPGDVALAQARTFSLRR
ncbi:hypothetical protein Lal_00001110 [Lupinus albus]|nr:hypothetical protein Lal_00001110 [Lupinus albus]